MTLATIATGIEIWVLFNALVLAVLVFCANEREREHHRRFEQDNKSYPYLAYSVESMGDVK